MRHDDVMMEAGYRIICFTWMDHLARLVSSSGVRGHARCVNATFAYGGRTGGSVRREERRKGSEGDGSGIVTDLAPKWRQNAVRSGWPGFTQGPGASSAFLLAGDL